MVELLAPFDREFKEVLVIINMQSILDIASLEKSLIERISMSISLQFGPSIQQTEGGV